MRKVYNKAVSAARLRRSLSEPYSSNKITTLDLLFQLLWHQKVVSIFPVASDMDLRGKKEKISQAKRNLLKSVEGRKEQERA